jgi:hypothetical protein
MIGGYLDGEPCSGRENQQHRNKEADCTPE